MARGDSASETWYGLQAGTILADRYRIERLVSRGGMGAVFQATQLGLDRPVAVKMLLPGLSLDEAMRERFRREARSVARLSHPNIIQVYDYGVSDHGAYIVMEFVRGRSLREILRDGPMPIGLTVPLMEQLCSALAAAHAADLVHRDLKPDNILVETQPDGRLHAKVLDFGIAKMRAESEDTGANLTGANLIGSPAYMSPEQCQGAPVDPRSDIYSLGVVLYEMWIGETPFANLATPTMLMHHVSVAPPRPRDRRGEISPALESVLLTALEKRREDRFSRVGEFAVQLRDAFEDAPAATRRGNERGPTEDAATLPAVPTALAPPGLPTGALTTRSMKDRRRLAILPLRNLAGDPTIEFLGFALADSVITQLAPIKSLIVRPSSSVEPYRNQPLDPRAVGRELQVDTILSGSYLKAGDAFRLTVQLIDVAQNEILWQDRLDLQFDNVIALQDRICEELIRGLRLTISPDEQEAIRPDEVRNPLAYELYLRGIAFGNTTEEHRQAVQMLEAAVNLDPSYAPAWAALAGRYINARAYLLDETMMPRADAALRKALELRPNFPAALFWQAVYYGETGDLKNAVQVCKKLLQAAPNSEFAYQAMAHAYDYAGLTDIALALFRKAIEINPVAFPYMIGFIHYQKGEYAEARREFAACPDANLEKFFWLSVIDFIEGDTAAAIARMESLFAHRASGLFVAQFHALLHAFKGEIEEGRARLQRALESNVQLGSYHYYITAQILAQLGDSASALNMLWSAVRTGYGNHPFLMRDPMLAPVRALDEFPALAEAMKQLQTQLQLLLVAG